MHGLKEIAALNDSFIEHRGTYRQQKLRAEAAGRRLVNRHKPVEVGQKRGNRRTVLAPVDWQRHFAIA